MLNALLIAATLLAADRKFSNVGRAANPSEIAERNLTITPDGRGLPAGSGNAKTGHALYDTHCSKCHGPKLEGDPQQGYPALAGGTGSLNTPKPKKSVGSFWPHAPLVFDYIRRTMPYETPRTLKTDEFYAITAYVLFVNGIVKEEEVLSEKTLPQVKMPNREGFIADPRLQKNGKVGR